MLTAHALTSAIPTVNKDQATTRLDPSAADHFTTPAKVADNLATLVQLVGTVKSPINKRSLSSQSHLIWCNIWESDCWQGPSTTNEMQAAAAAHQSSTKMTRA